MLYITNTFNMYVQLVPLPNKEATTIASTIFEHWICYFWILIDLITNQGKEFFAGVYKDLFHQLGLAHLK